MLRDAWVFRQLLLKRGPGVASRPRAPTLEAGAELYPLEYIIG